MDQETREKMCGECEQVLNKAWERLHEKYRYIKEDWDSLDRKVKAAESVNVSIINNPHNMRPDPLNFDSLHEFIQQSETFFAKYKQYANQVELLYEKAKPEIRKSVENE